MGFLVCAELLRIKQNQFSFLCMTKNIFGNLGLASVIIATSLVGFDTQLAMACSRDSSGSGLSHGSSLGSESVTVCVGSSGQGSGSSSTHTITRTVRVNVPVRATPPPPPKKIPKATPKPAPKKTVAPAPKKCPSPQQLASIPRSPDAAERWIAGICLSSPKVSVSTKPVAKIPVKRVPKVSSSPKQQFVIRTITETITRKNPGSSFAKSDAVDFYPNQLNAARAPWGVLGTGQLATFSSNPSSHYKISKVLGRQAQVHFVPVSSGWSFSDGVSLAGSEANRSFEAAGKYQATAWVAYRVSYRLVGESSWQPVRGKLSIESNTLKILVGASYLEKDEVNKEALLVGDDCRDRAGAFGCGEY
jgi:hypothetical protein